MKQMLKAPTAALFSVMLAASAQANDSIDDFSATNEVKPFTWAGLYGGAQVGYVLHESVLSSFTWRDRGNFEGDLLGGFVGFNMLVSDNMVVGIEADINATDLNDSASGGGLTLSGGFEYLATVGPRVGFASDRALFYAEGGFAFAPAQIAITVPWARFSDEKTAVGYFIGAGLDYAVTDHFFVGLEYNFSQLGVESLNVGGIGFDFSDIQNHTVKARLGLKF